MGNVTSVTVCEVPAGTYPVGEPGERRTAVIDGVTLASAPVTNTEYRRFVAETCRAAPGDLAARLAADVLADHPVVGLTFADASAYATWAGGRLLTSDEWEAAARGPEARTWPWGDSFDPERCNCDEARRGGTTPVSAHPAGASWCGCLDMVGNVWEWVGDPADVDGWRAIRGGCFLDTEWGLRCSRRLAADPFRATPTTGLRMAWDHPRQHTEVTA